MAENGADLCSFEDFCKIYRDVFESNGLSPHLLRSLHHKLEHEIFDAGEYFLLTPGEENSKLKVVAAKEDEIKCLDSNAVFLIDHAWTYREHDARKLLCEIPGLLPRIAQMMGYSVHGEIFNPEDLIVENILKDMWKYNQTFSIASGNAEDKLPYWYIMDEFGSSIQHSDSPTVAVVPFFYQPKQMSYSVMWLLTDLEYGDEVTRDYANYEKDALLRTCKLLPWNDVDLRDLNTERSLFPDKCYERRYDVWGENVPTSNPHFQVKSKRMKIYMEVASEFLTDVTSFEMVDDIEQADAAFLAEHIKDFRKYSEERPNLLINQFPGEMIMFCKDFFMDIARRSVQDKETPPWYPITFDLNSEFPQFISHFKQRSDAGGDENIWICKPWNLARSLGVSISNNLNHIIRLRETNVPKIASKYIENPVLLLHREVESEVKFDLRMSVLLASVDPLKVYVYDAFYARLARKAFTLDQLDSAESHLTALRNEKDGSLISYILSSTDFIKQFEDQNPGYSWDAIMHQIQNSIWQFFKSACSRPLPYGVGHYSNSRAIYGVDVMLEWRVDDNTGEKIMQPILLECNYVPNFTSMCSFFPSFLNDAFKFLYLNDHTCKVTNISDL